MRAAVATSLALTVLAAVAAAGTPAAAQEPEIPRTSSARLVLRSQSPPVSPGDTVEIAVRISGVAPAGGMALSVAIHPRVTASRRGDARETFRAAAAGTLTGTPLQVIDAGPINPGLTTTARFGVVTRRAEAHPEPVRVVLRDSGVYPAVVTVRGRERNEELARLVTFVVRLDPPPADGTPREPLLDVAMVLPFGAAPSLAPDGTNVVLAPAEVEPLDAVVRVLEDQRDVPATLLVRPETVVALQRAPRRDLVARLSGSLTFRQVLATTYVRTDVAGLVGAGQTDELRRQLTAGEDALRDGVLGGVAPDRRTLLVDRFVDTTAIRELRGLGASQAVVPEELLEPLEGDPTDRPPVTAAVALELDGAEGVERFGPVLVADQALSRSLTVPAGADTVLATHLLASELALIGLEDTDARRQAADADRPAPPGTPGVVLWAGDDWQPSADLLDQLFVTLQRHAAVLTTRAVDDLMASVPRAVTDDGGAATRRLRTSPAPTVTADELARLGLTRLGLVSFEEFVGGDSPLLADLRERLLLAPSVDLGPDERRRYVDAVNAAMAREHALVRPPAEQTVTLTSREGTLLFAVDKDTDQPRSIRIRLLSDKLDFPEGTDVQATLVERRTEFAIPVRVLATGTFPVTVALGSPDYTGAEGQGFPLGSTEMTVRSIAVPGLGIALTVGAFAFLLLWWASHLRRERRARRTEGRRGHPSTGVEPAG